jgi:hypothetical protein
VRYEKEELAIRLRKRQVAIQNEIAAQPASDGVSERMRWLVQAKWHTDALLSDIAAELGWQNGFSAILDREIESRSDAARIWGQ